MELSADFLKALRAYDPALDAIFDSSQDSICVWAVRSGGLKVLENVYKRNFGELYPEMERRVIGELKQQDVWKHFGSADKLDDHLAEQEKLAFEAKRKAWQAERQAMFKEDKWLIKAALENARHGRLDKATAKPFQIPQVNVVKPQEVKETEK